MIFEAKTLKSKQNDSKIVNFHKKPFTKQA